MKAGVESKTKVRIAIALCILRGPDRGLVTDAAWPEPSPVPVTAASPEKAKDASVSESLDPRLRLDLLANSEKVQYQGKGTNIFRAGAERVDIPRPTVPPLTAQQKDARRIAANTPPPPSADQPEVFWNQQRQG